MANSIALAKNYLPILDEIYKQESKSSVLEARDVKFVGANTIELFKTSMQGLGTYDRQNGFLGGDVTGTWEEHTLTQDRGRYFVIDSQDNEETLGMAFGTLVGEFLRTQVVPEVDAYCFAKIVGTDGISAGSHDKLADISHPAKELDKAIAQLNEDEVPEAGRICFMSEKFYQGVQGDITKTIQNTETGVNRTIETYDGVQIIRVPQRRFLSAITLYNGKDGQAAGGYVPAGTNYNLHFIMCDPSAIKKVTKHVLPRIWTPSQNLLADAYKFDYRLYYDLFVEDNKKKGIYFLRSDEANV